MAAHDEGALETVGWGPFALFGERKRLRELEKLRLAEVEAMAAREDPVTTPADPLTESTALARLNKLLKDKGVVTGAARQVSPSAWQLAVKEAAFTRSFLDDFDDLK